ncbi:MAG: ABC transporter permease [Anaerolineae bacterium]|nr:ABC transporter permease [Chloroflexota bacterium]MBN8638463.1 ABC transporter permease [Anaerolineae bacterium]
MAVVQQSKNQGVAKLDSRPQGESLWVDAWRRLRRNRMAVLGLFIIIAALLVAALAPVLAPKAPDKQVLADNNSAPRWVTQLFPSMRPRDEGGYVPINDAYPIGADGLGRDLLSRIIFGTRVSLAVAFIGPLSAMLVGIPFGLVAGYLGGRADNIMMRFVDIMYAFPTLLLIILLMAFFRSSTAQNAPGTFAYELGRLDAAMGGMLFIAVGVGFTSWMGLARLVRGQILSVREKEYIEAARSMGVGTRGIMFRHMLPNILGPIIVAETLTIPTYISYEAFLSFIGLGVQAPTASWGGMIAEGARNITSYPSQAIFPAVALFLIMFAFNFLGDGLRDALDPRMRGVD